MSFSSDPPVRYKSVPVDAHAIFEKIRTIRPAPEAVCISSVTNEEPKMHMPEVEKRLRERKIIQ